MKTAAIYARVSSEKQKEEGTIGSQTAGLLEYAKKNGYTVPVEWIFEDEGYSGTILIRPGLERLRDLSSEGQLESVLVHSPDRLSRKYAYQVLLLEEFSRNGVEVVFLKSVQGDTPEERLLLQFQGMIAEYERAQITERSRRGKRHRAKNGSISVLSGAPYGYRYIKKTDHCEAYYEVIESQANIVRKIYQYYTKEAFSINGIARLLNVDGVPTRSEKCGWERSTIWGILKNPAYTGQAGYGKTEQCERQKITRRLRQKGGFSPRCSATRKRPRDEWIEISVPSIISADTFKLAEERLERNKQLSSRNTKEPTLSQGLLVCGECGYSMYRSSTRTSKKKIYYYRCIGSDNYRHPNGRICSNRPIRQDYLDEIVWDKVIELLENPELIRAEMNRRITQTLNSNPTKRRKESLLKELTRVRKGMDKLLDAYQEDLLPLPELRKRIPELRKKQTRLEVELKNLEATILHESQLDKFEATVRDFQIQLKSSANKLDILGRQKIIRQIIKEIVVTQDTVTINHSIPASKSKTVQGPNDQSYQLCTRSD